MRVARRAGSQLASDAAASSVRNAERDDRRVEAGALEQQAAHRRADQRREAEARREAGDGQPRPSLITSRTTCRGLAPSAMRMPISRVRRDTRYAFTP